MLSDLLTKEGATVEELIEAGLVVQPEEGADGKSRQPWDRFRNRVIFPITDHSDRVIAFGARTLEPDGKPKYLNSSDSPLFHKGRTLYRYMAAREAMATIKEGPLSRGPDRHRGLCRRDRAGRGGHRHGGGAAGHGADRGAARPAVAGGAGADPVL